MSRCESLQKCLLLVRHRIGRKLVGDRTAKSRLLEINMTESQFADDVSVYTATREALEQVGAEFVNTAANWGLTVSLEKTKLLTLGMQLKPEDNLPVQLDGEEIAIVEDVFTYLGSSITRDWEVRGEVSMRLGRASRAFACLRSAIFHNKQLSMATKREVYNAVVFPTLLYGGRDVDSEGRQCEENEGLPQPLHQVHAGSVQAAAVEGEDHIKRTG